MKIKQTIQVLTLIAGLSASVAQAANGTWTNLAGGNWSAPGNWLTGTVADGTDAIADFSTLNLTAHTTVTLDGARTLGTLNAADTAAGYSNWVINASSGDLTMAVSSGSPVFNITNAITTINPVVAGTQGFIKAGAGILALGGDNTISGAILITNGTVRLGAGVAGRLASASSITVTNNGQLNFTMTASATNTVPLTLTGNGNFGASATVGALVANGNNARLYQNAPVTLAGTAGNTVMGGFGITFTNVYNGEIGGTVGAANSLIFRSKAAAANHNGWWFLNVANTYIGKTEFGLDVCNGHFVLGVSDALPPATSLLLGAQYQAGVRTNYSELFLNGYNQTLAGITSTANAGNGDGSPFCNMIRNGSATLSTLTVSNSVDCTYAGLLGGPSANDKNLALVKDGAAILTLTRTNTYTGNTTINAGTLLVNVALTGGGAVQVNGGTLGGSGFIGGAVTMASGTTLRPGTNASAIGTLTITNLTLASGSTLSLDIDPLGASNTDLIQTRDLAVSGPVVISFPIPAGGSFTQSRYVIMTYTNSSGLANLTLPPAFAGTRYALAVDIATPGEVAITVGSLSGAISLTWLGGLSGDAWDLNTTTNWRDASLNPETFYNADPVTFDDSAASTAVNVTTTVSPGLVTFNNTASNYTASGAGKIISAAGLSKTSSGNLTLNVPYEGGAVTNAGGGVMALTNASIATRLQVDAGSTVVMTGSNSLNGELTLDPANAGGATVRLDSGGYLNVPAAGEFTLTNSGNLIEVAGAGSTVNASAATAFKFGTSAGSTSNRVILKDGGAWTNIAGNLTWPNGTGANDNHLILTNGGQFTWKPGGGGNFLLGFGTGSYSNSVQVLGAASTLDLGGRSLYAGRRGTNNTALFDAGVGTNIAAIFIGDDGSSAANANNGSGVTVQNGARLYLTNAISFLTPAFSENSFFTLTGAASAVQADALSLVRTSGIFNFQGGALTLSNANVGNGQVFTVGDGAQLATLTLGGGSFTFSNGLAISANASLKGSGTVNGNTTVNGSLAPGTSVGALVFSTNLTLAGATLMEIDKANSTNDSATVQGTLTYGGTLTVTNLGGTLTAGDTFQLFSFTNSPGSFSSAPTLPTLGSGLAWTNKLELDGTIQVISVPVASPTLAYSNSAPNVITFSWTDVSFKLQWQTNALSVGLSTNWVDYPGGATSPVNVTNTTVIPASFFRLSL